MTDGSDAILSRLLGLHPKAIDLSLGRLERLLDALGRPQDTLPPVLHVAGTNGKGSTVAMLRAGLEGAGHRVHVYTSPHLVRFHERIRLAGHLIDEEVLSDILEECETANGGGQITFFEITTAAAFLAFARQPADYTILEVGLGGLYDATNVFDAPRLTAITPVGLDHQTFLGDTLDQIARAKAGILKRGVPGIIARQPLEARAAIEDVAARTGSPLRIRGQDWDVRLDAGRTIFEDSDGLLDLPSPRLNGPFQVGNAGTAIAMLRALGLGETAAIAALTRAEWPARMQPLRSGPIPRAAPRAQIFLDGGHNPDAGAALAETLAGLPPRHTHLVVGMIDTKDADGFVAALAPQAATLTAVDVPGEPKALPPATIAAAAARAGLDARTAPDALTAVTTIGMADPDARILITGSLYLAGQILRENG